MEFNCDLYFIKMLTQSLRKYYLINLDEDEPLKIDQIRNLRLEITKSLINEKESLLLLIE